MPLIDCLEKVGITDETVQDHFIKLAKKHQDLGLSKRDAEIKAVREMQSHTIEQLHKVYNQLGIKGYEDIQSLKTNNHAVQEQGAGKISLESSPGHSETLGGGNETKAAVNENASGTGQAEESVGENPKQSIAFAPFRERNVHSLEEDQTIRSSHEYQTHIKNLDNLAKELGVKIENKIDTWGGYVDSETHRPVQEVSNVIEVHTTPEKANLMAAILAHTAPETQDSVLVAHHNKEGLDLEHTINVGGFDQAQKALTYLKDNGIQFFTVDKATGDIFILDPANEHLNNILNLVTQLKKDGFHTTHEFTKVEGRFITHGEGDRIIESFRSKARSENGFDPHAFIEEAKRGYAEKPEALDNPPEDQIQKQGLSVPYANELVEHDVKPLLSKIGNTFKEGARGLVNLISPKTGVSEKAITHLMKALGSRNEAEQAIDKALGGFQKMFDKMKDADRVDFIDRMKRGEKQLTPELQDISDAIKSLDKDLYEEIVKYKPTLSWKENHYRVLWKEVPGAKQGKQSFWSTLTRRPFQGSKGFMKQATLADMSEGIAKGGVPTTTNPIKMFKLAYADGMKFVTAQRMFEALKSDKMVKFVKFGEKAPDEFVPISDRMAKVYYPAPEGKGMIQAGEWYIEEGAGRLLNNHLSRDYFREKGTALGAVGSGLMEIKNLYTQVELGLSGFHAIAEGLETVSSDIGLGLRKMINLGLRGDFKSAAEGLKDIALSFSAPRSTYITGRRAIKFASVKDFETSEFGKKFLAKFPDAQQYVHDFFVGGGIMKQHEDLRARTMDALKEHAGKDNYIGAALRAIPAMNEMILNPLFNHYIPALKVGMFFKEFPVLLKENKARLDKGTVTREQLARNTIDTIENRLGELNFDSLMWNRTFKTATQFMMRSVTWKLGNLRQMLGAPVEQAKEFLDAAREKRAPLLMPKMAWLFGLSAMQVALAAVIQKMASGKKLQTFKDIVAPQINPDDETERVILPTYYKDMLHLWHSKLGYITTSMSGNLSKVIDIWNNKDFYGYEIHDEHDSFLQKRKDDLLYFIPKPFSFSSASQMIEKGEPTSKVAMSFFGLNKAPGYLTHTPIENEIFDLYNIRNQSLKPKAEKEGNDLKKQIRELYKSDKKQEAEDLANDAIQKGILRPSQLKYLFSHAKGADNPSVFFFKELPFEDKKYLFGKMSDEEKRIYDPRGSFAKQVPEAAQ